MRYREGVRYSRLISAGEKTQLKVSTPPEFSIPTLTPPPLPPAQPRGVWGGPFPEVDQGALRMPHCLPHCWQS